MKFTDEAVVMRYIDGAKSKTSYMPYINEWLSTDVKVHENNVKLVSTVLGVEVWTIGPISVGEELFMAYGWPYWSDGHHSMMVRRRAYEVYKEEILLEKGTEKEKLVWELVMGMPDIAREVRVAWGRVSAKGAGNAGQQEREDVAAFGEQLRETNTKRKSTLELVSHDKKLRFQVKENSVQRPKKPGRVVESIRQKSRLTSMEQRMEEEVCRVMTILNDCWVINGNTRLEAEWGARDLVLSKMMMWATRRSHTYEEFRVDWQEALEFTVRVKEDQTYAADRFCKPDGLCGYRVMLQLERRYVEQGGYGGPASDVNLADKAQRVEFIAYIASKQTGRKEDEA